MKKYFWTVITIMVLAFSLVGCGDSGDSATSGNLDLGTDQGGTSGTAPPPVTDPTTATVGSVVLTFQGGAQTTEMLASGTDTAIVRALVLDTNGAAISGKDVFFLFSNGSGSFLPSNDAVTDESGIAAVNLQSSTTIGDSVLFATADTVDSNNIVATYINGNPSNITLFANPTQVGPAGNSDLLAQVKDAYGHTLEDVVVSFSSTSNSAGTSGTFFNPTPVATTDANGFVSRSYQAGNADAVDTVTASAGGATGTVDITVSTTSSVVSDLSVELSTDTAPADGFSSVTVTATIRDETGSLANAVPVAFSLSDNTLGSIITVLPNTNSAGQSFANFTTGTTAGVVTIIVNAGGFNKTLPLVLTAGQATSLALSVNPATITINGQAQLEATVLDATSNPVPNESVEFTRAFGGSDSGDPIDQTATTNARGIAKLIYTAGLTPAIDNFTAVLPNVANVADATATVTVIPDDTQIETINIVEVLPGNLLSTGTTATLIVEVLGSGGPLEGVALNGLVTGAAIIAGPTPALTDNFGRTLFTVTDATEETIEVRITGGAAVAKEVVNFGPPIDLTLEATPLSVIADGVSTVSIIATVLGADNDIPVSFSLTNAALGSLNQTTVNTVNGIATTTFEADTVAGAETIIAEAAGFVKTITVTLTSGPATTLTVAAAHNPLLAGNTTQLIATITDDNGNGIEGETVVFTLDSNGSETTFASGTATTDGRGIAKLDYTAGSLPGTDSFTADPDNPGVNSATVNVVVQGDNTDITSIVIDQVDPGTLLAATGSADVTVTVSGADGPLEGLILNAAVTGSATVLPAAPVTDQFGQATVTITGTTAENVVLNISGGSKAAQRIFNFGPTITLSPIAVSAIEETTLTAVLRDANGVPMPGVDINFLTTFPVVPDDEDNIVTTDTGITDDNGIVTATIADTNGNAGSVIVTAIDGNNQISSPPSTVTFQNESDAFALTGEVSLPVVTTGGTTTITATVSFLEDGSPAALQPVTFITTGTAILDAASGNTDSTGKLSVNISDPTSDAGTVVVTVMNGTNIVNLPVYFGAGIQIDPASSTSIADGTVEAPLTATVFDADNAVITGVPVHFSVTVGSALLSAGEVMTDVFGQATVLVTDSIIESVEVDASAGDLAAVTADIDFLPGAPANMVLTSAPDNTTPLSLFGDATVTATVTDALGNNVEDNTPVLFFVSGTASNAIVTSEVTTSAGVATAALSAGSVSGSLTVTVIAGEITETINFTVASSEAGTVGVESVDPEFVQMLGQPGVQSSTITFSVRDPGGNPVADGTVVDITLDPLQLGGGELISDGLNPYTDSVTTQTVAGLATVLFRSGVVAGTVDITATVATTLSTDISSVAQVTVISGMPDSLHLPVSGSPLNVPARIYDGCTSAFNITVGDRYGNPVPDGSNVSFMVEPSCGLIGSTEGFMTTTDKGKITETFDHAVDEALFPDPPLSDEPLCTVVAYMTGDEGFEDLNGNGIWDATEPCPGNQGEPYVDANDNGSYDIGELYNDVDGSGTRTPPNVTCDTDTTIWRDFKYLQTGNITTFNVAPAVFSLQIGQSQTFTVNVSDFNGAPPIAGTTLSVSTDKGTLLNGGDSVIGDTTAVAPWIRSFTLLSDIDPDADPELATISISLSFPGGLCGDNGPDLSTQFAGVINQAPVIPAAAPTVSFTVPAAGATDVTIDSEVTIFFSEPMNTLTVNGTSVTATCGGAGFNLGPVTAGSGDQAFTFKPAASFPAGVACNVTVAGSVRDVDDDLIMGGDYSFSFDTAP